MSFPIQSNEYGTKTSKVGHFPNHYGANHTGIRSSGIKYERVLSYPAPERAVETEGDWGGVLPISFPYGPADGGVGEVRMLVLTPMASSESTAMDKDHINTQGRKITEPLDDSGIMDSELEKRGLFIMHLAQGSLHSRTVLTLS